MAFSPAWFNGLFNPPAMANLGIVAILHPVPILAFKIEPNIISESRHIMPALVITSGQFETARPI